MSVNTQASSANRLEILLFKLSGRQLFGINVLKVKEIIPSPHLTQIPQSNHTVLGVAELRGHSIPVLDLGVAIGRPTSDAGEHRKVIIAEVNRRTQGFMVTGVERIIVSDWKDVLPPPSGVSEGYITGVIRTDEGLVQIIDVERVLSQFIEPDMSATEGQVMSDEVHAFIANRHVLIVDDSSIARTQTARTLDQLGIPHMMANDGVAALKLIKQHTEEAKHGKDKIPVIISDIEMPEMDGYQLTKEIRSENHYSGMYILLHTSLDGQVNSEMAAQAGADNTLTKFVPELLAEEVINGIKIAMKGNKK
ncbi:chemotaxis protein [Pseudomonadota bacterium]